MRSDIYRYDISEAIPVAEVEATLVIVLAALESLHGESQVCLAAPYYFDVERRACIVDASSDLGRDFSRLLIGLLRREFGRMRFECNEFNATRRARWRRRRSIRHEDEPSCGFGRYRRKLCSPGLGGHPDSVSIQESRTTWLGPTADHGS